MAASTHVFAGVPTAVIRTSWTNVPMTFEVLVMPVETCGTFTVRRSLLPASIGMTTVASGPLVSLMHTSRRYLDSSFEFVVCTDRAATVTVRRRWRS